MFKSLEKIIKYPRLTQNYPQKALDTKYFIVRPYIDREKCNGCGECSCHCPTGAIVDSNDNTKISIKYDECIFCAMCEEVCPVGAVRFTNDFELAQRDRSLLISGAVMASEGATGKSQIDSTAKADGGSAGKSQIGSTAKADGGSAGKLQIEGTATADEGSALELTDTELEDRLREKIRKLFGRSLQIREVDAGSCNGCDYEVNGLNNPFNDIERLGIHFVASPRHADMLLVTGPVSRNMEQALIKTYEATPDPKLVVAIGTCACSGGIFRDCYATGKGIDTVIPVDVYVPGCPPRPQTILYGILKALDRVK